MHPPCRVMLAFVLLSACDRPPVVVNNYYYFYGDGDTGVSGEDGGTTQDGGTADGGGDSDGGTPGDGGTGDGGPEDGGASDSAIDDGGSEDGGSEDGGSEDGGSEDGGSGDDPSSGVLEPSGEILLLDYTVIEARFDTAHDQLITVAESPDALYLVDPLLGTWSSVALDLAPQALSVSPDGSQAAVGHDGWVSIVDLDAMEVTDVYSVSVDALDVELPGNGWVYVFPRSGSSWDSIRCVELETGTETESTGGPIYAGTTAAMHPTQPWIYGADNGLSPNDIEKYDTSAGVADYVDDSPYHGDYSFNGEVWLNEEGTRILARSGNSFQSSAVSTVDMTYAGRLEGWSGYVGWMDSSAETGLVYVTAETDSTTLHVFDYDYLTAEYTVDMPDFETPSTAALARRAFASADGETVFMLVQGDDFPTAWGLVVLD